LSESSRFTGYSRYWSLFGYCTATDFSYRTIFQAFFCYLDFTRDIRGGSQDFYGWQMNGRAKALPDDRALRDVVAFIGTLPESRSPATIRADMTRGKALYAGCAGCHGAAAEGRPDLSAPALAGLDDWYQLSQLQAFRHGQRGTHKEDTQGAQMRAAAVALPSETALREVVAYIASIP